VKRISSPDSAHGHPLRTKMILFFLAASATILTVTAINLFVFLDLNGVPFPNLTHNEKHFSSLSQHAIPLLILLSLCGVALIAWLTFTITSSLSRSLATCSEFVRELTANKLDGRLPLKGTAETADLTSALNAMAESLHNRFENIKSVSEALASVETALEKNVRQVTQTYRIHETGAAQAAPALDNIGNSSGSIAECFVLLEQSTASANKATSGLTTTGQGLVRSSDKLGASFGEVSSSTAEMSVSLKELSNIIVDLLTTSVTTAASVVQLDASLTQVEKIALEAVAISENITIDAETGMRAAEETIAGMQAIRNSSHTTSEAMQNLSRRVDDIGVILSVIDDLAEQTDLLALNATIIAAQASGHGKGFAVVADEIRELAERTSSSTREISIVIRGVQNETRRAVDAIQQAEAHISAGQKLSRHSGTALEKIVRGVQQANTEVLKIARTTGEQARDSHIIKESMQNITKVVQKIATASSEHAQTSGRAALAAEHVKTLTSQVRSSIAEQSVVGDLMVQANRDTFDTINLIRAACSSQAIDNATVSAALNAIRESLFSSSGSVIALEKSRATFEKQLRLLKMELSAPTP